MFRWRKRDEGFEWHQYVRTTIKLRREARRDKAQRLGQQAAEGAKAASTAAGVMAETGARHVGAIVSQLAASLGVLASQVATGFGVLVRQVAAGLGVLAANALQMTGQGLGLLARGLGTSMAPLLDILGRPAVAGPLIFVGFIAALAGTGRALLTSTGLDGEASAALIIGLLCLAGGIGPAVWLGHSVLPTRFAAPLGALGTDGARLRNLAGGVAVLAVVVATVLAVRIGGIGLPSLAALTANPFSAGNAIQGQAGVIAADLLRVGDTTVRLAGIEAPDREQRCTRSVGKSGKSTWPCGETAREAAQRLVRSGEVKCEVGSRDATGIAVGRCRARDGDIAETLVKAGHVFAEASLLSPYRAAEGEARSARSGLWSSAEPERPGDWRKRIWATAKQESPEGCPIKGQVTGGERIYLLPWASRYPNVRISKRRGERWFCSEEEALAAGWRQAGRG